MSWKNNDEEFAFGLSTHGAWMLLAGIKKYMHKIERLYKTKIEEADYCFMMSCTAHDQVMKVREWAVKHKMQNINLNEVDYLIEEITKRREKFRRLEIKRLETRKKIRVRLKDYSE